MASSDSSSPASSSEDEAHNVRKRRLPRARYTTFDGDDGDDAAYVGLGGGGGRAASRRTREEAIYGVFYESNSDNEKKPRFKRSRSSSSKVPPLFIKGATLEPEAALTSTDEVVFEGNREPAVSKLESDNAKSADDKANGIQKIEDLQHSQPTIKDTDRQALETEQKALNEQQEEANRRFLALLTRGRGKRERLLAGSDAKPEPVKETKVQSSEDGRTSALDAASFLRGDGTFSGLGSDTNSFRSSTRKPIPNPSLGTWEKHTKGIGMKLLAKMGYSGSGGLGNRSKREGISKPVEVKVRPSNLGLGFGNFKEATQLKSNRQIEAQVRGVQLEEEKTTHSSATADGGNTNVSVHTSSSLPTVQDLLNEQAWRKGPKNRKKRPRRTIVPYTELLRKEEKSSVVIDMRVPQVIAQHAVDQSQLLAEEVLYNVTLITNTYETKLLSESHFLRTTQQKITSLQSDVDSLKERQSATQERMDKLKRVLTILDQVDSLEKSEDDSLSDSIERIKHLIEELGSIFTSDEKKELKFSQVMVPSLVGKVVQSKVDQWKPLKTDLVSSEQLMRTVFSIVNDTSVDERLSSAQSMLVNHLLPRIQKALESSRWDPARDSLNTALQLYEVLCKILQEIEASVLSEQPTSNGGHEEAVLPWTREDDTTSPLIACCKTTLIHETVYSKLLRSIEVWKPSFENKDRFINRLDRWILPWLPHLDHLGLLPSLLSDCKRKVSSGITFLQKSLADDAEFFHTVMDCLSPWCGILKPQSLQGMVSSSVTPRLAKSLSRTAVVVHQDTSATKQVWTGVDAALDMNRLGILSDLELLSVVEGELLPHWANELHSYLSTTQPEADKEQAVHVYYQWKARLLFSVGSPASILLNRDEAVCRYFHGVLCMIRAAADLDADALDDLRPATNKSGRVYRKVLARRVAEEKQRAADDLVRMGTSGVAPSGSSRMDARVEARVRLNRQQQGGYHTPVFREVVADYCTQVGILFQPRLGSNAMKDGKQIFNFGSIPVYLESDVVFANVDGAWKPMRLECLAERALKP